MLSDDLKCFSVFEKVPQILHGVFNLIETHHPVFFRWFALRFRDITYTKNLCFLSRQHVTVKTVISLKIQQNIDFSQRAALANVDFR